MRRSSGKRHDHSRSFGEHYLKHIALGEGCNCAESVLRTLGQAPLHGDSLKSVTRVLKIRISDAVARMRSWLPGRGKHAEPDRRIKD
jgi:hypothetical protein